MRSVIIALSCLAIGILGALGYSHYLGEGKQLADLQADLSAAKTSLAKVTQDSSQAKSETEAMLAQIQQLSSTKEDLKKQLDELKSASPGTPAPAAPNPMAGIMKAQMASMKETKFLLLKSRLHLTPEQEAAVKAAMDQESKRTEDMASQMLSGGKIDPQAMADLKNVKTLDQTLDGILTPDQKTAYQQMKTDEKGSSAEMQASFEMNQVSPLLQLSDSQKDQVGSALYQVQLDAQDPAWAKKNANPSDPTAYLNALEQAKEDALSKVLTPDQLATYRQQAQAQLKRQKAMMQKFMPPSATVGSTPGPVPATGTASP